MMSTKPTSRTLAMARKEKPWNSPSAIAAHIVSMLASLPTFADVVIPLTYTGRSTEASVQSPIARRWVVKSLPLWPARSIQPDHFR